MNVQILNADQARAKLADDDFRADWTNLQNRCRWATSMQSLPFVEAWYEAYAEKYEPVFAAAFEAENKLAGLLSLAVEKNGGRLVVAGDALCEYATWLAADLDAGNSFIGAALDALEEKFPNAVLQFLYLARATPLGWLDENKKWRDRCVLKKEIRPLLRFDDDKELLASLKKKHSRSRLNQMKKRGAIELERVTDAARFEEIFDTVKSFGDLRLSAVHRVAPDNDAGNKKFHVALFKANMLFVTLMKIGEDIASAHFDLRNGDSVMLGMTALSPFFAKNSPRKFHIMMACLELLKQNVRLYDLTPGGNYKDRHANSFDEVHVLTVYFTRQARRRAEAGKRARAIAGNALRLAKIERETLDEKIYEARHKLKFLTARTAVRKLNARVFGTKKKAREMRIYALDVEKIKCIPNPNLMNRNRIEDLLKYEPTESWHPAPSQFHRLAAERLSEGVNVYTKVENGKLVHWGWMVERQEKSYIPDVDKYFTMPENSSVLFDFFTHPQARGKGFYQSALRQILHDVSLIPNTRRAYIAVDADNAPSRHSIEKVGFEYDSSLYA